MLASHSPTRRTDDVPPQPGGGHPLAGFVAVAALLIVGGEGKAQLSVAGTSGSVTAALDFRGQVFYNLGAVGGPTANFAAHDFAVGQTGTSVGSVNFSYPAGAVYDFPSGIDSLFRLNVNYTNNTGVGLRELDFTLVGSPGFFRSGNGFPARGGCSTRPGRPRRSTA